MARVRFPMMALVAGLALFGCKKTTPGGTWDEETMGQDPIANFQNGVFILQSPDKNGIVDYTTAYTRFNTAAQLGAGAKASYNAAWTAQVLGQPAESETHYRQALQADPTYESALFALAALLQDQGRAAESAELFSTYLETSPDNLDVRNDLVNAHAAAGNYDAATSEAQQILRQDPENAAVYRNLSAMYYDQGNYGMAQLCNEKALALNDGDAGVYNNMAVTYLQQSDEPAAIEKLQTARKINPNHFEANTNLGYIALNSGDYGLALQCFEKSIAAQPADLDAKLGLAVAARGVNDFDRAAKLYDEIIKADPNQQAAYFNAATLHEKYTKDYSKALKYLEDFRDSHPGLSPSHEVFSRMDRVQQSKNAEEERKRQEAQRKKEEEDRQRRNQEILDTMGTVIAGLKTQMTVAKGCLDEGSAMEVEMIVEQAEMIVQAGDTSMASDIQMMLDGYIPGVQQAYDMCNEAGGAAAPADGAPAEEAPAEGEGGEGDDATKERPPE